MCRTVDLQPRGIVPAGHSPPNYSGRSSTQAKTDLGRPGARRVGVDPGPVRFQGALARRRRARGAAGGVRRSVSTDPRRRPLPSPPLPPQGCDT